MGNPPFWVITIARVLSPAGRALMPQRREELQRFLADLRRESDDLRSL